MRDKPTWQSGLCRGGAARRVLALRCAALGLTSCFLAAVPLLASSCAAPVVVLTAGLAVAQVGTTAYANGELQTSLFVDFAAVVESARAAHNSLGLEPTHLRYDGRKASISASDLGNRSVTVEVTRVTGRVCKISIRVGFWGDQSMSRLVLIQMQKELGELGYVFPAVPVVATKPPPDPDDELEPENGNGDGDGEFP